MVKSLPVKEGAAGRIVERLAEGRGHVQRFLGLLSMEVMRSGGDEVLVVTRWQNRVSFDAWVRSEELRPPSALTVPTLTLTVVK